MHNCPICGKMCDCGKDIPGLDLPADCTHCIGNEPDGEWDDEEDDGIYMSDDEDLEDDLDEDDFFPDDDIEPDDENDD